MVKKKSKKDRSFFKKEEELEEKGDHPIHERYVKGDEPIKKLKKKKSDFFSFFIK